MPQSVIPRPLMFIAGLATQLFAAALFAEDWTEFRGPTGMGTTGFSDLPVEWSPTKNVAWKKTLPGKAWSSPVVANGRIYLTTALAIGDEGVSESSKYKQKSPNAYSLRTLCLDAETSDKLWDVEVSQVPPDTGIHPKNSHASGTPVLRGNQLFVHFGKFGTASLDLNGNILWKKEISYKPVHGSGGSPVLYEDLLIFNCDGGDDAFVIALDTKTGEEQWRTTRDNGGSRTFSFSTPLLIDVDGSTTLVSAASNAVFGYNPSTGEQLWVVRYPNKWSIVPRPVFAGGLILICTGYEGPAELLAIRPGGRGDVTETHIQWRENKFIPHNPSPIIHDNAIYLVSDAGIASCRDLATGKLHWRKRLGDDHSASPFLSDGKIFFLSEEGLCTVIEASSDEFKLVATNDMSEHTLASMVPLQGAILLRTENALYRLANALPSR